MLLAFIMSLAQDPDIQEAYRRDPVAVVSQRQDLSSEEKALLLSKDPRRILEALSDETGRGRPRTMMLAPTPLPWVYGRQTVTGFFWEPGDGELLLTIFGTKLEGAFTQCELRHGATHIRGEIGQVEITPGGEKVTLRFALPPNAPQGVYWAFSNPRRDLVAPRDLENLQLGFELRGVSKGGKP
ncbi:hypothetical protein [Polyangium mundeleinium]|uniref:Uncharacterized protein n=1 Tax=Polyangium mundeleinium TaxID=2995306 RepID=A0ABT5ES63_9BACT|nr:hypothetical protein [Polyangium mundeleinium]MDC0744646.1 hypothetical protein [Polyangium mundeleinium]